MTSNASGLSGREPALRAEGNGRGPELSLPAGPGGGPCAAQWRRISLKSGTSASSPSCTIRWARSQATTSQWNELPMRLRCAASARAGCAFLRPELTAGKVWPKGKPISASRSPTLGRRNCCRRESHKQFSGMNW
eukprot:7083535-Lingulodinium_polyedra.AAC.1